MGMGKMKAIICTEFGQPEVLQLREIDKPVPGKKEVLIRIYATTVSSGDCRIRRQDLSGVPFLQKVMARMVLGNSKPRSPVQGLWLAGKIESTGEAVSQFHVGDKVYARTPDTKFGAYAEYASLSEKSIMSLMPSNLSFEEAIALPFGGVTALYFLKKTNVQKDSKVLIYGASGAVGSMAVQIAKYYGATVTGVSSTTNTDLVKSLGADRVIDYLKEDFLADNDLYDIVFDTVGKINYPKIKTLLKSEGKYISVVTSGHAQFGITDLVTLTKLTESGKIKPVIDRKYSFEQMAEAHRYVDLGHKKGNVVITVK
jgi:NADPH:quinone reductase-like Zn-dependent oxidoreductase